MNDANNDNLIRDIEQGEAWLAEVMRAYPEPQCPSFAHLKQCVRIAVDESALSEKVFAIDAPQVSPATLSAVKSAVRAELAQMDEPSGSDARQTSWWRRNRFAVGTLAAAAAVLLVLTPVWLMTQSPDSQDEQFVATNQQPDAVSQVTGGESAALGGVIEDWEDALALDATGDFDTEVASLESEIGDLYDTLTFTFADEDTWDGDVDDLDDSLDALFEELESLEDA